MRLIAEHKFPARGPNAPGSVVLRDQGPKEGMRYVTHWRNDQVGGFGRGEYHKTLGEARSSFSRRVAEETLSQTEANPEFGKGPFHWALWGSDRTEGNDDCWIGGDAASFKEAEREMQRAQERPASWSHAYIDGPDGQIRMEINQKQAPSQEDDRSAEISEAAGMAGMAFGVRGRNEVYGEDVEEEAPFGMRR